MHEMASMMHICPGQKKHHQPCVVFSNKKRNSLVCFCSSRPWRRGSHRATTTKKNATHWWVSAPLDHDAACRTQRQPQKNATHWYVSATLDHDAARGTDRQHQRCISLVGFSSSRPQCRKPQVADREHSATTLHV